MKAGALVSRVCAQWLTETEHAKLPIREAETLFLSVNLAVRAVWAALPIHLRRKSIPVVFKTPITTTTTLSATPGESFRVNTNISTDTLDCCTADIGDGVFNELRKYDSETYCSLFPYMGGTSGTLPVTIYRDAAILPVLIERVLIGLVDVVSHEQWKLIDAQDKNLLQSMFHCYCLETVSINGAPQAVIRIDRKNAELRAFELQVQFRPADITLYSVSLSLINNVTEAGLCPPIWELPYGDDVANWIIRAAGQYLIAHPRFRQELLKEAMVSKQTTLEDIAATQSTDLITTINEIGPPPGY